MCVSGGGVWTAAERRAWEQEKPEATLREMLAVGWQSTKGVVVGKVSPEGRLIGRSVAGFNN